METACYTSLAFFCEASSPVPGQKPNLPISKIILYTSRTRRNRKYVFTNAGMCVFVGGRSNRDP